MFVFTLLKFLNVLTVIDDLNVGGVQLELRNKPDGFERRIYFFKLEHFDEISQDLAGAMQRIENLPFTDEGRYQSDVASGSRLVGYPDTLAFPLRFRFGRTRTNQLPDIEEAGKFRALEVSDEAGLIDMCHMIIFEDGYAVAEFNYDGPRISKLGHYLFEKGGGLRSPPVFLPLFERDIVSVIDALDSVSLVKLSVPPSAATLMREADENVYAAIEGGVKAGGSKAVELKMSAEKNDSRLKNLASKIAKLVKSYPHERERINLASVDGFLGGKRLLKPIDLLEDKLVSTSIFERNGPRSRSVRTLIAYEILEREYAERVHELREAVVAQ